MTATATWPEAWLRGQEYTKLAEDLRANETAGGATSWLSQEAVILGDGVPFDVFDAPPAATGLGNARAALDGAIQAAFGPFDQALVELAKTMGSSRTAAASILPQLADYMALNTGGFASTPLIQSRQFTRGSPSYGGSNVGNGVLYRLSVDQYGYPIESDFAETINFRCERDAQSGVKTGAETFSAKGGTRRDSLTWYATGYGSGLDVADGAMTGVTGIDSAKLLQNPSFSSSTGTGSGFVLNGWTLTSGVPASMSVDTVNYYRASSIESTPGSLACTGSVTITQTLAGNGKSLQQILAYFSQLAVTRQVGSTGTGSVTVQIGSKSWTVSLSAQTGWVLLQPPIDKDLWFLNFNTNALTITITITVSSGTIRIDDLLWAPWQNVAGKWVFPIGGTTPWKFTDTIQLVDTEAGSKIQRWLARRYGTYLPSAVLPTPPAAPTVANGASSSPPTAGDHWVAFTYVTAVAESPPGPPVRWTADGVHQATVTITAGPGGTTKRGVYATTAGDVAVNLKLIAYVNDNTTLTQAFAIADGALTALAGSIGDPS